MKKFKVCLLIFSSLFFLLGSAKGADNIGMVSLHDFSSGNNFKPQERNIQETQKIIAYNFFLKSVRTA